jgi:DDE family transposase
MKRWKPAVEQTKKEQLIMKRLGRVRALFGFLREKRHLLFDEAFQERLEDMYRQTGSGAEPHAPALLCMVTLLQGYVGASDAEAVELSVMDRRWQLVLDCMDAEEPPFSQGALQGFRERMIAHDMDRVLLERTAALVRAGVATDAERQLLSKAVRVAIDSRPLVGAGRVEDTLNLLGHAARLIVKSVSKILDCEPEEICRKARIPLLLSPSIKAGLDIDWSDPRQKVTGVQIVEQQVASLVSWVEKHLDDGIEAPLKQYLDAVVTIRAQDLEVTKNDGVRIRQEVAADRRISIEDAEMRHGRKSRSKRFNGFKEHIALDLDARAILACAVTPANRPEEEGAAPIAEDIDRQGFTIDELHIDRAYVNSPVVASVVSNGGEVLAKPWALRAAQPGLFSKADFRIDMRAGTITCPAGEVERFEPGETVHFDPEVCGACPRRTACTKAATGKGRTVSIAKDEAQQKKFRRLQQTSTGRAKLRARVGVEHALAHIAARKGTTARYIGVRKNLFDLRRASAIQNLEALHLAYKEAA